MTEIDYTTACNYVMYVVGNETSSESHALVSIPSQVTETSHKSDYDRKDR